MTTDPASQEAQPAANSNDGSGFGIIWLAVIGVIVAGGALYFTQPNGSGVGSGGLAADPLSSFSDSRLRSFPTSQSPATSRMTGAIAEETPASELTLPEEDREYLWEVEHLGSVLGKHGFGPLKSALANADAEKIMALLADDFTGQIATEEPDIQLDAETLQVSRLEIADDAVVEPVDGQAFVDWLMSHRAPFMDLPQTKISLMTLRPEDRSDFASPWQGTCRLRMWGDVGDGKPAELFLYLSFTLDQPTEERLASGAWLRSCRVTRIKQARADGFLMHDVAKASGIDVERLYDNWVRPPEETLPNTGGVYVTDYNRDGWLDLLITDLTWDAPCCVVYQGRANGKFEDVTDQLNLPGGRAALTCFVDLDGDGWEDLILAGRVLKNIAGERFEEVSTNLPSVASLRETFGNSHTIPADFDLDGQMDLYICRSTDAIGDGSWISGKSNDAHRNQLLRNTGDFQFEDVTEATGTDGGGRSVFTSLWLDANDDGRPDLYVIHEFGNGVLLINEPEGKFRELQIADGPADFGSMGATCGDYNNDGKIDIYVASMYSKSGARVIGNLRDDAYDELVMKQMQRMVAGSQLYRNDGDLEFEPVGVKFDVADVGWAYGPAMADLNNDGWLDMYATAGFISRTRDKPDG